VGEVMRKILFFTIFLSVFAFAKTDVTAQTPDSIPAVVAQETNPCDNQNCQFSNKITITGYPSEEALNEAISKIRHKFSQIIRGWDLQGGLLFETPQNIDLGSSSESGWRVSFKAYFISNEFEPYLGFHRSDIPRRAEGEALVARDGFIADLINGDQGEILEDCLISFKNERNESNFYEQVVYVSKDEANSYRPKENVLYILLSREDLGYVPSIDAFKNFILKNDRGGIKELGIHPIPGREDSVIAGIVFYDTYNAGESYKGKCICGPDLNIEAGPLVPEFLGSKRNEPKMSSVLKKLAGEVKGEKSNRRFVYTLMVYYVPPEVEIPGTFSKDEQCNDDTGYALYCPKMTYIERK
jgi:hypothetical protein